MDSPLWALLRESGFSLDVVVGWKFRIGVEADNLVLTEAEPVPAADPVDRPRRGVPDPEPNPDPVTTGRVPSRRHCSST